MQETPPRRDPPTPRSLTDRIAASLRDEILRGRYLAGDRLPSERELAERYATHRGAVREAFKKLEQLGIAEIRKGGARAAPIEEASLDVVRHLLELDSDPDPDLFDQVFEVFGGLFSLAARLAAERADDDQRERARQILERLTEGGMPISEEHALIHSLSELFVVASGNRVLPLVRRGLHTQFLEQIEDHEALLRPKDAERRPLLRNVARAIAASDGPGAANTIFELTQAVRRNAVEALRARRDGVNGAGTTGPERVLGQLGANAPSEPVGEGSERVEEPEEGRATK